MAKDFSGQRLRGQRFTGDLRGANFRGADLRGASFRGADLTSADFCDATLGRPSAHADLSPLADAALGVIAALLTVFSVVFLVFSARNVRDVVTVVATGAGSTAGLISADYWLVALVYPTLVIAAAIAAKDGQPRSVISIFGVGVLFAVLLASLATGIVIAATTAAGAAAVSGVGTWLVLGAVATGSAIVAAAVVASLAVGGSIAMIIAGAVALVVTAVLAANGTWARAMAVGIATLSLIALGWYLRHRALAEDIQFESLRRWILAISAWSGTDFRDARLTGADFSGAQMRFARLGRPADLTGTRFRGTRDLRLAYVRGTILADRRVRDLLVSGEGTNRNFDHADLHGTCLDHANLRGARLCDVELTGADLSRADLTDADLSRATMIGANLTGASLTGACLDGWNIDTATRLDGVVADYVFLESSPNGERRERRPQGDDTFGPNDFTTLFKRALKTVDLIFRNGIDWDAFRAAFDDLRAHYAEPAGDGSEAQVRVQSIDNTEDGRIIIRVAVPDEGIRTLTIAAWLRATSSGWLAWRLNAVGSPGAWSTTRSWSLAQV